MKRLLLLLLLIPCICFASEPIQLAKMSPAMIGSSPIVASGSCQASPYLSEVDYNQTPWNMGDTTDRYYWGTTWQPAANKVICKVAFEAHTITGDVSSFEYVARVWTTALSTYYNIVDQVGGASDHSHITATGWIEFTWSSNMPSLSSGTLYAITVDRAGVDASNYVLFSISNADNYTGAGYVWRQNKTWYNLMETGKDALIKVYVYE